MDLIPFLDLCDTANSFLNEKFTLSSRGSCSQRNNNQIYFTNIFTTKKPFTIVCRFVDLIGVPKSALELEKYEKLRQVKLSKQRNRAHDCTEM